MPKIFTALRLLKTPKEFLGALVLNVSTSPQMLAIVCGYIDERDKRYLKKTEFAHVPGAALRFKVSGHVDLPSFLNEGQISRDDIINALARIDKKLDQFTDILDFGCGCGRVLLWITKEAQSSQFYGTDMDTEAIAWCADHLPLVKSQTNNPLPPFDYPAEAFDLIYGLSVFTHLNEDFQNQWLAELQRVTKPGGILLLTFHGEHCWSQLPADQAAEVQKRGFLFDVARADRKNGLFPDWYQTAFHTKEYVSEHWGKFFEVLEFIPQGSGNWQDIVLLRKR